MKSFICALLILTAMPLWADDDEPEAQVKALQQDIKQLKKWLQDARSEQSGVEKKLRKTEQNINKLNRKIDTNKKELQKEEKRLKDLHKEQLGLKDSQALQQHQLHQQIKTAYKMGQQPYLQVLFNQQRPDQVARALTYFDYVNRARSDKIQSYTQTLERLSHIETDLKESYQQTQTLQESLNQRRVKLTTAKDQRQQVLASLKHNINNKDNKLNRAIADRKRLQELLNQVDNIALLVPVDNTKPFKSLKGKLPWPTSGKRMNRFGTLTGNHQQRWKGWLIRANEGSSVQAIHHGRIVFSDWLRGFGLLTIVDHGNGYLSLYGRNQSLLRDTGEWVNAGDAIATVGNSGGFDQVRLYFEIRAKGKPQNPSRWLNKS
jgi:septal ring factor EnvC (AmiA/AmiB activator)